MTLLWQFVVEDGFGGKILSKYGMVVMKLGDAGEGDSSGIDGSIWGC